MATTSQVCEHNKPVNSRYRPAPSPSLPWFMPAPRQHCARTKPTSCALQGCVVPAPSWVGGHTKLGWWAYQAGLVGIPSYVGGHTKLSWWAQGQREVCQILERVGAVRDAKFHAVLSGVEDGIGAAIFSGAKGDCKRRAAKVRGHSCPLCKLMAARRRGFYVGCGRAGKSVSSSTSPLSTLSTRVTSQLSFTACFSSAMSSISSST